MSLALYRRYRPTTFAEVIGQEHVTTPLRNALASGRVHHAYLFSGPRGCGKTTSARILARALNCEQGPTPEPCGECASCQALSPTGGGSLDVIEIDAASHNGVDDARDLRETTAFAPASSRFKVYIIDEAHMVTPAAFNALLKTVEEPPPHVKFVFATTEPDKVLSTIRSRTHHYPFHLVPPGVLEAHLADICQREGVTADKGVLPLVVRAGAGSVRDALSVLDQLIAGSEGDHVSYGTTVSLLGYTDATLLDDVVEALAAGDGAAVFSVVDRVVEGGHDPRRFAADLLERLRDLVIVDAVPDAARSILRGCPDDQIERMQGQAARFGRAALARAADIVNGGLTEMRGATAPRLHLELLCARLLLPGADEGERGLAVRLARLERRLDLAGTVEAQDGAARASATRAGTAGAGGAAVAAAEAPAPGAPAPTSRRRTGDAPAAGATTGEPAGGTRANEKSEPAANDGRSSDEPGSPADAALDVTSASRGQDDAPSRPSTSGPAALDVTAVRRMWSEVLAGVRARRRTTWALVSQQSSVLSVDEGRLLLAVATPGLRDALVKSGHDEIVRQALIDVLGVDWKVEAVVDPGAASSGGVADRPAPAAVPPSPAGPGARTTSGADPSPDPAASRATAGTGDARPPARGVAGGPAGPSDSPGGSAAPRRGTAATSPGGTPRPRRSTGERIATPRVHVPPEEDLPDDDDLEGSEDVPELTGRELLERELGASVIDEFDS